MNRKKRILFVTEASIKTSGYSIYSREILKRLHSCGLFEVAELACFCDPTQDKEAIMNVPWPVFVNKPARPEDQTEYYKYPSLEFGEFSLNAVMLNFKPDFVMDIRDWFMHEHQASTRSVFRDYYKWIPMPTVDSIPQNDQWIETYTDADAVFTYSEFGRDGLLAQSDKIRHVGIPSPAASQSFRKIDNARELFGIEDKTFIFGTVMRNQPRKLYPELFKSFKNFLSSNKKNDAFLYCHTYYPDLGWDIPKLLLEYGLSSRVLFTYKCQTCGNMTCNFFHDVHTFCRNCNKLTLSLVSVDTPTTEEELAHVYNIFDCYVQYANCEGFGMPVLEAAYCDLPIMTVDYSAMQSVGNNIDANMIPVLTLQEEQETGQKRAIPHYDEATKLFRKIYNTPKEKLVEQGKKTGELARSLYDWDRAAQIWIDFYQSEPVISEDMRTTWLSPPKIHVPAPPRNDITAPKDQATYLFERVLGKPNWVYGYHWRKMVKDLTYRAHLKSITNDVYFFNESHIKDNKHDFIDYNFDMAYEQLMRTREDMNRWEENRWRLINGQ